MKYLTCPAFSFPLRLEGILHQDVKLYLVFEFMQMDLKKYIDTVQGQLDPMLVKVREREREREREYYLWCGEHLKCVYGKA